MGGGTSNSKLWTLFVNAELVDGSKYLGGDAQFREIFVDYVKSGQWEDRLANMIFEERKRDCANDCAVPDPEKFLMGYIYPEDSVCELAEPVPKGKLVRGPRISKTSRNVLSESFVLANCMGFTSRQLESIMFSILYPLFASTPDEEFTPRSSTNQTADTSSKFENGRCQRTQEIISACSEQSSEEEMHDFLQNPEWVFDTSDAFENFPLSVSICDTRKPGCPIVFANKAFEALSGYTLGELTGRGLEILHGEDTQAQQVLLLKEAVATGRPAKVAVTHYNKKQKAFLDLVAMRASAHYSVAVHFSSSPGNYPEDLKMVDDLLLLVSCVLQAPLQKSPARRPSLHGRGSLAQIRTPANGSVSSLTRLLAHHTSTEQVFIFNGNGSGDGGLNASEGKSQPPGSEMVPTLVF